LLSAAAHNLGLLMRSLFQMGTPRGLQEFKTDLEGVISSVHLAWLAGAQRWRLRLPLDSPPDYHNDSPATHVRLVLAA
jgi:hypothetical protein